MRMTPERLRPHLIERPTVFHVGTLEQARKGHYHTDSLEGHCLSVSLHPEAWVQIARLGGEPVWRLDHETGYFANVFSIESDPDLCAAIRRWGIENGLAQTRTCWRAWQYDSEEDDWRYMVCDSEEEAQNESDEFEERAGGNVEAVSMCVGTPALCERIGWKDASTREVLDFLTMAYIEDNAPDIQGVWWDETLDPDALSAPRAGILPSRLSSWTVNASELEAANDFTEGAEYFSRKLNLNF